MNVDLAPMYSSLLWRSEMEKILCLLPPRSRLRAKAHTILSTCDDREGWLDLLIHVEY